MRWAGIDEAGYGPNLGPMVMTAVVAEGPDGAPAPDMWADRSAAVCRAGGPDGRLWVDDSKKVAAAGRGHDRLDAATLATLAAAGRPIPTTLGGLLAALGAGTLDDAELTPWLGGQDPRYPALASRSLAERTLARRPLDGDGWRVVDIRSVVVGPARFNALIAASATGSKAAPHSDAFARLVRHLRATTPDGTATAIRSDKHGGRNFYAPLLAEIFPAATIARGAEGPALSHYDVDDGPARLAIDLMPRADADDGLVALASMASKAVRERWMAAFNGFWQARRPGIRPTAGYPVDAGRFRREVEADCLALGLEPADWWRSK